MYIFPVIAFFCEGQPFWSKWHISQFLTRVTGGYVMLAEVVFRNVVTQRSTKVSTQLCLLSTYVCLSVSLDSSGVLSLFGKFEILLESSQQGHSGFGLKPEPKLNQTKTDTFVRIDTIRKELHSGSWKASGGS